jgi:hypothetical protein
MSNDEQLLRVAEYGIKMTDAEQMRYLQMDDTLSLSSGNIPNGYKRCTKCGGVKKIYLFNRNSQAKDGCTTQCKECQKNNAHKSYAKNKHKCNYKKYYQEHKEEKQAQSRQYYQEHKEDMATKHAKYRNTKKGKKVMLKAHAKRARSLKENTGIPYTREMIVDRDCQGGTKPICYLCGHVIDDSGTVQLDHVIPVVMGGKDCFTNIACTHVRCNLSKSKDGREITTEQVESVIQLSEEYAETHQELFPDLFASEASDNNETTTDGGK